MDASRKRKREFIDLPAELRWGLIASHLSANDIVNLSFVDRNHRAEFKKLKGSKFEELASFKDTLDSIPAPNRGIVPEPLREKLKDKDFALIAIQENHYNFRFIPEALKTDFKFALEAVKKHWRVYNLLSKDLRANKEIAISAIKQWPLLLDYAVPSKFLEDKDNLDAAMEIVKEQKAWGAQILGKMLEIKDLNLDENSLKTVLQAAMESFDWQETKSEKQHKYPKLFAVYHKYKEHGL